MRLCIVILAVLLFSSVNSFARGIENELTSDVKHQFCQVAMMRAQSESLLDSSNRIAFTNAGGMFNGGVCWWHSRLQRSAAYLAVFRPELPKPASIHEVKLLLRPLKRLSGVVEIPGYKNFKEFTAAWPNTVQRFLNAWQAEDGILYFSWIKGLAGSSRGDSDKLWRTMDNLRRIVVGNHQIAYMKLQLKGISAHAWLVNSMQEIPNGYRLSIIDSNYLDAQTYDYHFGDASLNFKKYGDFMPYLEENDDFPLIDQAIGQYCQS